MGITWTDDVDEILGNDVAAGFAVITPARGVVIMAMAPLGLRDRDAGTVTITSSLGLPKKLDRIRADPSVALCYHAREHGVSGLRQVVLVQGTATVPDRPDREWLESIAPQYERFLGPRHTTGLAGRLLHVYNWERVPITVSVERIVVLESAESSAQPAVLGPPLPAPPDSQKPPGKGTGPRVDLKRAAAQHRRLPHTLLGWVGGDGFPMLVPVEVPERTDAGLRVHSPAGLLPPGGRRAGLLSHRFQPRMVGQENRGHTGWLEVDGDRAIYAPHTKSGYAMPASQLVFDLGAGLGTRMGLRAARRANARL